MAWCQSGHVKAAGVAGVERVGRGVQEGGEVPARGGSVEVGSVGQRARQGRAGGASKIVF